MILHDMRFPRSECSIRIPHIFFLSTHMSFGGLIHALMPWFSRSSTMDPAVMSLIMLCTDAAMDGCFRTMLKVRFLPGSECHWFSLCPLPENCSSATTTDKLSRLSMCFLAYSLVESTLSSHIMSCPFVMVRKLIIFAGFKAKITILFKYGEQRT